MRGATIIVDMYLSFSLVIHIRLSVLLPTSTSLRTKEEFLGPHFSEGFCIEVGVRDDGSTVFLEKYTGVLSQHRIISWALGMRKK